MELNSLNNSVRASPKEHSCHEDWPLVLEKMFKEIVDRRRMPDIG